MAPTRGPRGAAAEIYSRRSAVDPAAVDPTAHVPTANFTAASATTAALHGHSRRTARATIRVTGDPPAALLGSRVKGLAAIQGSHIGHPVLDTDLPPFPGAFGFGPRLPGFGHPARTSARCTAVTLANRAIAKL